jgi:hypothetical protein
VHAQTWYERRGFRLVTTHAVAVARDRELKPSIPHLGRGGVPVTDELEYEYPVV